MKIDIMDVQKYKHENPFPYVLLASDTYTKYLQGVGLKNRKPDSVIKGLKVFLNGPITIETIYWDKVSPLPLKMY